MSNLRIFLFFLLGCIGLWSCQDGEPLVSRSFSDNCWEITDSLEFSISYENLTSVKEPMMTIAFLHDYPDRNIFIKTWITAPNGNTREEIIEDVLFDVEGNWLKEEGISEFTLKRPLPIKPEETGTYQVKLTQFTRRESLCDIEFVEIRY